MEFRVHLDIECPVRKRLNQCWIRWSHQMEPQKKEEINTQHSIFMFRIFGVSLHA